MKAVFGFSFNTTHLLQGRLLNSNDTLNVLLDLKGVK